MTQSALADAIDVKKGFISEIVSNKKSPSLETLVRIAGALNVGVGDLFANSTTALARPSPPPGLKDEAVPFDWQGFRDGKRSSDAIEAAQRPLRHPATYQISAAIPWLALLSGDVLICDLGRPPADGEIILVGKSDADGFNTRTLVRRAKGHLALSGDPAEPEPLLDLEKDHRAAWRATVCGVVRLLT